MEVEREADDLRTGAAARFGLTVRRVSWAFVALVTVLCLVIWLMLRASLPVLDGRRSVPGLTHDVEVARDRLGVPTVIGSTRADVAMATGWLHAQDRFFQMDLLRRDAAGELSALFGSGALEADRAVRIHRFRAVARAVVERLDPASRAVVDAYTAGVNAGLADLRTRPFEYWLLRVAPEKWRAEDTVLVILAMFLQLQESDGHYEIERGLLSDSLPAPVVKLVYSGAPEWEATLDGSRSAEPTLPTAEQYDLRRLQSLDLPPGVEHIGRVGLAGSNNWAVGGNLTANGAALVANDMHLGLRVPNTWYRARLVVTGTTAPALDVTGITLPGVPPIVVGSNGRIAWGFTNTWGDYSDVIILEPDPVHPDSYRTATGSEPIRHIDETIVVRGANPVRLTVLETRWGPVIGRDLAKRPVALAWAAHDPEAINFEILGLERATSVQDALAVASHAGIPAQNLIVGDAAGHIAWSVIGRLPVHTTADGSRPHLSTEPDVGFGGWVPESDQPHLVDPGAALLWTANAQVIGGHAATLIGDGGVDRGSRARQILSDLTATGARVTPRNALGIQLDDRALFLERWRRLLNDILDSSAVNGSVKRAQMKNVLAHWSGRAEVDDPAYRLVRDFRLKVERSTFDMLIAPARMSAPKFDFEIPRSFEGPLWRLVTVQPPNLLAPRYSTWHAFLLGAADAVAADLLAKCGELARCTWGTRNTVTIRHPLAGAVPGLGWFLNMPTDALPGDEDMPRVQGLTFGASERFAVSPGHEAEGYFQMPGGQSGHPLSPFYRAGHEAWVGGELEPFLPGPSVHTLQLMENVR